MPTLGERLAQANAMREQIKSKAEREAREANEAKFLQEQETIRNFFKTAYADFERDITMERTPRAPKLPSSNPFNTYSWENRSYVGVFDNLKHPHHSTLNEFFKWADDNGLVGQFKYEWDGGGMDSWFRLVIVPKE